MSCPWLPWEHLLGPPSQPWLTHPQKFDGPQTPQPWGWGRGSGGGDLGVGNPALQKAVGPRVAGTALRLPHGPPHWEQRGGDAPRFSRTQWGRGPVPLPFGLRHPCWALGMGCKPIQGDSSLKKEHSVVLVYTPWWQESKTHLGRWGVWKVRVYYRATGHLRSPSVGGGAGPQEGSEPDIGNPSSTTALSQMVSLGWGLSPLHIGQDRS